MWRLSGRWLSSNSLPCFVSLEWGCLCGVFVWVVYCLFMYSFIIINYLYILGSNSREFLQLSNKNSAYLIFKGLIFFNIVLTFINWNRISGTYSAWRLLSSFRPIVWRKSNLHLISRCAVSENSPDFPKEKFVYTCNA